MAVLSEDVIVEIAVRLPLKNAIRCLVLNKNLFSLISQRKNALVSSWYGDIKSSIFYCHSPYIFKRFTPGHEGSEISITLPEIYSKHGPLILDSCNGLLLIAIPPNYSICVFNPITGGIMFVDAPFNVRGAINLAVDLDAQKSTFHFKLVKVDLCPDFILDRPKWKISVLVPVPSSGPTSWLVKTVEFNDGGGQYYESAYFSGCMYWPQGENRDMIVLNVENLKTGKISWPFSGHPQLFGLSDGSLQNVSKLEDEIVIHSYDQMKDEWELKHKITNSIPGSWVEYFDGQRLLITQEEVDDADMYIGRGLLYDTLTDKWEKISGSEGLQSIYDHHHHHKTFFTFVPTLAKVSHKHLKDAKTEFPDFFSSLEGLQRLITKD